LKSVLIFGGSFDPVHNGHLNTALDVQKQFKFYKFIFLPCKIPLLKNNTQATAEQRSQMLRLALRDYPFFSIDLREIQRGTPSYMSETLNSFRQEMGHSVSITLLLGLDAFQQFNRWHQWQNILTLSHLLIMNRPDADLNLPQELEQLYLTHKVERKRDLLSSAHGKILLCDAGNFAISSTWIRSQLQQGNDVTNYVPQNVLAYIKEQDLYQV
jgi:nicotinate-nucleotide adenylyltransferase